LTPFLVLWMELLPPCLGRFQGSLFESLGAAICQRKEQTWLVPQKAGLDTLYHNHSAWCGSCHYESVQDIVTIDGLNCQFGLVNLDDLASYLRGDNHLDFVWIFHVALVGAGPDDHFLLKYYHSCQGRRCGNKRCASRCRVLDGLSFCGSFCR
jgi:hypothetical protein